MSLAYTMDERGTYQVAYEAMDKVSVFKCNKYTWMWWCPCHSVGLYCASHSSAMHLANNHLQKDHSEEE